MRNRRISANTIAEWLKPDPVIPRDSEKFLLVLECLHAMAGKPWPLPPEALERWKQRRADAYAEARTTSPKSEHVRAFDTGATRSGDEAALSSVSVSPGEEPRDVVVVGKIPAEPVHFVAREQLRMLAQSAATSPVSVVVTGMRGVGKTQLAAAYAREAMDSGVGLVGWVDAETDGTLLEGLAAIASRLGVADPEGDSQRSAHRLRDHLVTRREPGVLVFDNATNPDRIGEFVPVRGGTRVVITSTDHSFTTLGTLVDLEVYTRAESIAFLRNATGLADDYGADRIAQQLGDLPLALTQAAATIVIRRLDYTRYEALLDQPLPAALTRLAGSPHPHRVDKAILLSLETTEATSGDAELDTAVRDLLELIAMLSPAGVWVEILPDGTGRLHEALARCEWGSLLTRSTTGDAVLMHRLISRVLRERASTEQAPTYQHPAAVAETGLVRLANNALTVLDNHSFDTSQSWNYRDVGAHLIDHLDSIWNSRAHATSTTLAQKLALARIWAGRHLIEAADTTRAISYTYQCLADAALTLGTSHHYTVASRFNLALAYFAAGRVEEAVPVFELTLTDAERVLGLDHPDTLLARKDLAEGYAGMGWIDKAIPLFEQTLADTERVLGLDPLTLAVGNQLANTYQIAGRMTQAIALHEQTLADRARILGSDHPDTLTSRSNLALAHLAAGHLAEAITASGQTLTDRAQVLGPDHPLTLISRGNLALAHQSAGRLSEAVMSFERNLADCERALGPDHPETLRSRGNLAAAYLKAGRVDEATVLLDKLLADSERVLSHDHPDTLCVRGNLAHAYQAAGRAREAVALFERNLADCERALGPDHPATLHSGGYLAAAYMATGRLSEATALAEQNRIDRERVLGADSVLLLENSLADAGHILGQDHPDTLRLRNNLAAAYHAAGRTPDAVTLLEQLRTETERVLGSDHPFTMSIDGNLAYMYVTAGRVPEAIALSEQTLTILQRLQGPDTPQTLVCRSNLAFAYRVAGRIHEAVAMSEQTRTDAERILGGDHPDTLTACHHLADAYHSAGRVDEAIPLYERICITRERVLGPIHPDTLAVRNNLAHAFHSAGRLTEAITLFERTLAETERTLGEHPSTLTVCKNLADAYHLAGRVGEATAMSEQALAKHERVLGPDHPDTLTVRNNLGDVYLVAGRVHEAVAVFEQTLADAERILGLDHPDTLTIRDNLARSTRQAE
ncbi:tetratricopeptide repeat protein [Nocardia sp. NPDC058519]|uniref:tetratricopeptide repeat protein n=1 Tax=Nocardia sp. NPDC058519 TaxID=3346535 RepID=UPI00365C925B